MSYATSNTRVHACSQSKRVSLGARISNFLALARQRRQLATLDQHLLSDIGLSRAEAIEESRKSPWNAPQYWQL